MAYSQGFNPHPKIGFAQPLSLGYEAYDEYMEFETADDYDGNGSVTLLESLKTIMPDGLTLVSIREASELKKTLASMTVAAEYEIRIQLMQPLQKDAGTLAKEYMEQKTIVTLKKQKKKKDPVPVDIKPKIREIAFIPNDSALVIKTLLDAGSDSNLSPELLIDSVIETFNIQCDRAETEISRIKLQFNA